MKQRILSACMFIPLIVLVLLFSGTIALPVFVALVSCIAYFELMRAAGTAKYLPLFGVGVLFCAGFPFIPGGQFAYLFFAVIGLITLSLIVLLADHGHTGFRDVAVSVFAALMVSFCFSSLIYLRALLNGERYLWMVFIGAWTSDAGAYFIGRALGRHKLAPAISPKKTVEGAFGGILFCVAAFLLYGLVMRLGGKEDMALYLLAIAGVVVSLVSQIGDLAASVIKREFEIKDYGRFIPGHGGILDRFDSILFVGPFLYMAFTFFSFLGSFHLP